MASVKKTVYAGTSREGLNGCSLLVDPMAVGWGEVVVCRRKACLGMEGIKRMRTSGASKRPQCYPLLLLLMGELWAWWDTGAETVD